MSNEKILIVPGRYDQIQVICEFVAGGARDAGLNADAVFHMELCCDEASTNIIEHAYGAEDVGEIRVTIPAADESAYGRFQNQYPKSHQECLVTRPHPEHHARQRHYWLWSL